MDNTSIIKQSIDICINQIDYTEFGLKESKKYYLYSNYY